MREALSGVALAVVVASCGLVPPLGSRQVAAEVTNTGAVPVELTVETSKGVVQGAVQPASLPPGGRGRITFFLPAADAYTITVNGMPMITRQDFDQLNPRCRLFWVEVNADGSGGFGCGTESSSRRPRL